MTRNNYEEFCHLIKVLLLEDHLRTNYTRTTLHFQKCGSSAINQELFWGCRNVSVLSRHCQSVSIWKRLTINNMHANNANEMVKHLINITFSWAETLWWPPLFDCLWQLFFFPPFILSVCFCLYFWFPLLDWFSSWSAMPRWHLFASLHLCPCVQHVLITKTSNVLH